MPKRLNDSRAFTLIELLLAVGLFSIVSLSLYATFSNGLKLDREAGQIEDVYREAGWVISAFERDLESLVPYYSPTKEGACLALKGTADKVSLILATDKGMKQVIYYLKEPNFDHIHKVIVGKFSIPENIVVSSEEQRNTKFLVREERPVLFMENEEQELLTGESEILSRFVEEESFSLSYAKGEGDEGSSLLVWKDAWEERYPPVGLRIRMRLGQEAQEERPLIQRDILIPIGMWGEKIF